MADLARSTDTGAGTPHLALIDQTARFAQAFQRWLDGPGVLTYPRLRVVERLHCQGPAKLRELADEFGLSARNLTTLADALEHEGLVRRTPHPVDRRATLLDLTDAGNGLAESMLDERMGEISRVFDSLTPAERDQFAAALATLLAAMQASPCSEHHDDDPGTANH